MGPLDVLWHLLNLFWVPLALGLCASTAAKLVWRQELRSKAWQSLALPACAACTAVALAGLVVFGQDGKMATYGAMVVACALMLWWRGFGLRADPG
jgi:hypothetical protein